MGHPALLPVESLNHCGLGFGLIWLSITAEHLETKIPLKATTEGHHRSFRKELFHLRNVCLANGVVARA